MFEPSRCRLRKRTSAAARDALMGLCLAILIVAVVFPLAGCQGADDAETASGQPSTGSAADNRESSDSKGAESTASKAAHGVASGKREANRLAEETSPYLLMHAHNPVDWFPWGEEAFAKARREGKMVFLSIGYSSCYWCHVMERESFLSREVADFLNEHFVSIKVDREERPDVDDIYMTALQLRGVPGGWPLSMFLTPEAKPFYGGTYFPQPRFLGLLKVIEENWRSQPEAIRRDADRLTRLLRKALVQSVSSDAQRQTPLDAQLLDNVQSALAETFDPTWGGFGYDERNPRMQKFPVPPRLMFLLRRAADNPAARKMLELTLDKMAAGGVWDHLGGGFHRYSTDRYWHIPHFEKMLYDNAQLATVYAEAFELTGNVEYRRVVESLLGFVLRDMTGPEGEFFAAIDAETDAEEGKFYRWDKNEVQSLLSDEEWKAFSEVYGFSAGPNFEHRYYVPLLDLPLSKVAVKRGLTYAELDEQLAPIRERLLESRGEREHPLIDTKVITAWNGLMIRGFADGGRTLDNQDYIAAASRAAQFVLDKLQTKDGRLLRTYRQGQAKFNGYLDDYAFMVDGLIALHRATGQQRWLTAAEELTNKQMELFWDEDSGGFFFTSHDHESLVARAKSPSDSVLPSGNSVAAGNLIYLAEALNKPEYLERARETISAFVGYLGEEDQAGGLPRMAMAVGNLLETDKRISGQQNADLEDGQAGVEDGGD